jgi:hypothetical protein
MPFFVYAAMLSSQLIVAVGGRVPEFDVGPGCRDSTVSDCLSMERFARDTLTKDWPSLTAHDRAMCDMEEKISGPPSYIGWLTCLEINANARSPEANSSGSAGATGCEATPKRHDRIHRRH